MSMMLGAQSASAAPFDFLTSSTNNRPWWDPTQVIEVPVDQAHAEGSVSSVSFTDDATGGHQISVDKGKPTYGRVQAEATGFTPGLYYTVRITLREASNGNDWGVYTWQTYKATADGKLHINLRVLIPSRAKSGERVAAGVTVYSADQVRQDGRPKKQDPKCVLNCKRVAPLAAWTNYSDPQGAVTIK